MSDKTKFPLASVIVPILVPTSKTEAPTTGKSSSSEMTTPVTLDVCAVTTFMLVSKHAISNINFLIISFLKV